MFWRGWLFLTMSQATFKYILLIVTLWMSMAASICMIFACMFTVMQKYSHRRHQQLATLFEHNLNLFWIQIVRYICHDTWSTQFYQILAKVILRNVYLTEMSGARYKTCNVKVLWVDQSKNHGGLTRRLSGVCVRSREGFFFCVLFCFCFSCFLLFPAPKRNK